MLARLRADPSSVVEIFLDETRNDARGKDLAAAAERAGVRLMRVPTKRLDGFYGGGRHQGVVARSGTMSRKARRADARTLGELKEREVWIVGADERAPQTLYEADLPPAIAWVLGAEGEGMRRLTRENCDLLVRIPMNGDVDSLNVSVSAGICLFESVRRRS